MKVRLGQNIKFNCTRIIELEKGGTAQIKPGDIAKVVKKVDEKTGEIVYLTGEAKGLAHRISLEVDDVISAEETDEILKKVMDELNK